MRLLVPWVRNYWEETMFRLHALLSVVAVAILVSAVSTPAQPIINEWSGVKGAARA